MKFKYVLVSLALVMSSCLAKPVFHYKDVAVVVNGFYKGSMAQVIDKSSIKEKYIVKLYFAVGDPKAEVVEFRYNSKDPHSIVSIKGDDMRLVGNMPTIGDSIFKVKVQKQIKYMPPDYD